MPAQDRWHFEKVGLGYRCWNDENKTEFRLTHIKRSHGDLTGELRISTAIKDVKTNNGILHVARFNVLSSSSRAALARMLEKRTPGQDMDWFDGLEWLCQGVILAEQQGSPVVELGSQPAPPPGFRFAVEPLVLKKQPSLLFGPGGVGKSLIALACALSVSSGREIIPGLTVSLHANALYLDWETDAHTILERMQAIARGHEFDPSKGFFYRQCSRPLADDVEELSSIIAEKKVELVVVDSAAHAMGVQGEYGDANESVIRMHAALRLMDVGSLIVDHVNKTEARGRGGTATPYGSAYKTNTARNSWEVRKAGEDEGMAINLFHAKANDFALRQPISVSLDWTDQKIVFQSSDTIHVSPHHETMSIKDLVFDLLDDGAKRTPENIAKDLNLNSSSVRVKVRELFNAGRIQGDEGLYWRSKMLQFPGGSGRSDA